MAFNCVFALFDFDSSLETYNEFNLIVIIRNTSQDVSNLSYKRLDRGVGSIRSYFECFQILYLPGPILGIPLSPVLHLQDVN